MGKAVNSTGHPVVETVHAVAGMFRVILPHARNRRKNIKEPTF